MVAYTRQRLTLPLIALTAGVVVSAGVTAMPLTLLEAVVIATGLPALLPAAAPPLGDTARAGAALLAGLAVAAMAWLILRGRSRPDRRGPHAEAEPEETMPIVRKADAHPDAPPRPPVIATRELGAPLMSVHAEPRELAMAEERPLPRDLDVPLADYATMPLDDDNAAPIGNTTVPRPATFEPSERFETFALSAPPPSPRGAAPVRPVSVGDTEATLHALLERLDAGVARRQPDSPPPRPAANGNNRLDVALASLRRLAAQS